MNHQLALILGVLPYTNYVLVESGLIAFKRQKLKGIGIATFVIMNLEH